MSKSDDMRQMRERNYAQREHPAAAGTEPSAAPPPAGEPSAAAAEQGKCAVCGKVRPLSGGLIGMHQKGFGKVCAGSRKAPA